MAKIGKTGLQQAVDHFGGVDRLAEVLGITRQAIYMWRGRLPRSRAFEIESKTGGALKADALLGAKNRQVDTRQ